MTAIDKAEAMLDEVHGEAKDLLNRTAEEITAGAINESAARNAKRRELLSNNRNVIGGLAGIAIAAGLELLSPTGSKKSAAVAALAGGGVLYLAKPYLDAAPQTTSLAGAAGAATLYAGMLAGRITADYFPGNLDLDD